VRKQARLVIIGAGIVGASAAYHLSKLGWRDMVVVDQGPLFDTGGSTSHAPGLVFQTNASKMMTGFARYTVALLNQLKYQDQPVFYPVGGIEVAYSRDRWEDLKRKHGWAQSYGLDSHLITPSEVKHKIPILDEEVIQGGYYVPSDGDAKAVRAVAAMARQVQDMGAGEFYGDTTVNDIEVAGGRIKAVVTDHGRIQTEMVLLCTNIWAPPLGEKVGVKIPLMAVEHQYLISEPLEELGDESREIVHPILRHQDFSMYFRQHANAYGIGSYKHEPLLVDPHDLGKTAMRPFTAEHFDVAHQAAVELLPALKDKQYVTRFNGMFAFTADGMPILGPAAKVDGLWVAVGVWVTHAGGVGKAIAEWMSEGVPSLDLHEADISRFHSHVFTRPYIYARCAQQYREVYDIIHPLLQMERPRNLRLSPFHARLKELAGVFFESSGWERPQWYDSNAALLEEKYKDRVPHRSGWAARYWSPVQGAEHLATRQGVAMYELGAFTKIEVGGPGALTFLEYLAANRIDRPVGKVIYTSFLDKNGGIQCDLTITRLAQDRFLVLTGGGVGMHDLAWIRQNAPADGSVYVIDVSSRYSTVGLWGPKARDVLQTVCQEDVSNSAFPYFTAKSLSVGSVPALALRVSYVGELGWEIYAPSEYGTFLWDTLWEAARPCDVIAAGGGAFDSLRLEKGYRLWGADIHTEYNPFEAGLDWAVRLDKGDFLGRSALLRIRDQGVSRKLCCMTFDVPEAMALGKEPILDGDQVLGFVTSTNYGYSVGKHILYGYLPIEYAQEDTQVEVEYFARRYPATVVGEPLYDPGYEKLKS
jgi:heterotetrameric sarcosine oxidase gamma subunit